MLIKNIGGGIRFIDFLYLRILPTLITCDEFLVSWYVLLGPSDGLEL